MQLWADRLRVRYVYISRTGLQGSSGNHGDRRLPKEAFVTNAVVDGLKSKFGFDDIALTGQSGGATIAASLPTLGRKDVRCEVLGSGATEAVDLEPRLPTALASPSCAPPALEHRTSIEMSVTCVAASPWDQSSTDCVGFATR